MDLREQAIHLRLDHLVTFTDPRLQAGPIQYGYLAAAVLYQAGSLQVSRCLGDTLATHTQHIGNQFLCHGQLVRGQAVEAQEQPAAQLLVQSMMPVAHGGLRHLGQQALRVA